jgi:hypothetical protein
VDKLVAEFQKQEERSSRLEWSGARVCDLLLGPPSSRARLADRLEEAAGRLEVEQAARREADVELEALWTSFAWVRDLVLDWVDRSSSLATSQSMVAELLDCWLPPCALTRVGSRARPAPVWVQCRPNRGSGGCPLDLGAPSLRLTGVARPSFGCSQPLLMARENSSGGSLHHYSSALM